LYVDSTIREHARLAQFAALLIGSEASHESGPDFDVAQRKQADVFRLIASELDRESISSSVGRLYPVAISERFSNAGSALIDRGTVSPKNAILAAARDFKDFHELLDGHISNLSDMSVFDKHGGRLSPGYAIRLRESVERFIQSSRQLEDAVKKSDDSESDLFQMAEETCLECRTAAVLLHFAWDQFAASNPEILTRYRQSVETTIATFRQLAIALEPEHSETAMVVLNYAKEFKIRRQVFDLLMQSDRRNAAYLLAANMALRSDDIDFEASGFD
jgi:hypothetical protein